MKNQQPVSNRTITQIARTLFIALSDPEQDWFSREELLEILKRVHLGIEYRQLSNDIKLLKEINCPYLNHLKNFNNLNRQSVECLIAFRWLVRHSNRHQACLSINYVMEKITDYEPQFRPESSITIEVTAQAV
ncbi:MAG: hypothetical protein KA714_26055 [Limnoraphis sp. WC205]|nr:hypothetical protein [Limnoraphis sp. WC205]